MSINNSGTQNKEFAWPGDIIKYIPSGFKLIAQKDSVKFFLYYSKVICMDVQGIGGMFKRRLKFKVKEQNRVKIEKNVVNFWFE